MSARFQRLFCAGCFALVLLGLPGALREVRRGLGGPYAGEARASVAVGPATAAVIAEQASNALGVLRALGATGATGAWREPGAEPEPALAAGPGSSSSAEASSHAELRGARRSLSSSLRVGVATGLPVLFREALARPGI